MLLGAAHVGKAGFHGIRNFSGIVHAQGGLRDYRQLDGLAGVHAGHVVDALHQVNAALKLAHRALYFGVAFVADHDEFKPLLVQLGDLHVHLGHQRAGGIKNLEAPRGGFVLDRLAHTVGAEHQRGTRGHVVQFFNENCAFRFEIVHDIGVVHDFMAHVDGATKLLQRALHNLNGAVHARAKTTGLGQNNFLGRDGHRTPITWTSNVTDCPASGWLKSNSTASPTETADASLPTCITAPA